MITLPRLFFEKQTRWKKNLSAVSKYQHLKATEDNHLGNFEER